LGGGRSGKLLNEFPHVKEKVFLHAARRGERFFRMGEGRNGSASANKKMPLRARLSTEGGSFTQGKGTRWMKERKGRSLHTAKGLVTKGKAHGRKKNGF